MNLNKTAECRFLGDLCFLSYGIMGIVKEVFP